MDHKLRALVRVDLTCSSATIQVTGCFTTTNYRALVPVIRRARALPTHPMITVDVSRAKYLEPQAVLLLDGECRSLLRDDRPEAVNIIAPLPEDEAVVASSSYAVKAASATNLVVNPAASSAEDTWTLAS